MSSSQSKLENENSVLKEKLQKLESKLELHEGHEMEAYINEKLNKDINENSNRNPGDSELSGIKPDIEKVVSGAEPDSFATDGIHQNEVFSSFVNQSTDANAVPVIMSNKVKDVTGIQEDRKQSSTINGVSDIDTDTNEKSGISSKIGSIVPGTVQVKRQTSENVAFHVYLSGNRCYGSHETFVFDVEVSDYGNGYNVNDGIFDVPITGVYVFTLTVLPKLQRWVQAEIVIDGSVVGKIVADSDHSEDYHSGSATVVVHVTLGAHVFVRRASGGNCDVIGNGYARTTFSGWLLF